MYEVWEPTLNDKIHHFLGRKSKEYPDLNLLEGWGNYEYTPRHRSIGSTKKHLTR